MKSIFYIYEEHINIAPRDERTLHGGYVSWFLEAERKVGGAGVR